MAGIFGGFFSSKNKNALKHKTGKKVEPKSGSNVTSDATVHDVTDAEIARTIAVDREYAMRNYIAQTMLMDLQELAFLKFADIENNLNKISKKLFDFNVRYAEIRNEILWLIKILKFSEDNLDKQNTPIILEDSDDESVIEYNPFAYDDLPKPSNTTTAVQAVDQYKLKEYPKDPMKALLAIAKDIRAILNKREMPPTVLLELFKTKLDEITKQYQNEIHTDSPYKALANKFKSAECVFSLNVMCDAIKDEYTVAQTNKITSFQESITTKLESMSPRDGKRPGL